MTIRLRSRDHERPARPCPPAAASGGRGQTDLSRCGPLQAAARALLLLAALAWAGGAAAGAPERAKGAVRYVSHGGSDLAEGTLTAPWKTLRHAMRQLHAGDTLFIRGSPRPSFDPEDACASPSEACWTESERCGGYGTCSPLHWVAGEVRAAGAGEDARLRIAAYPGEVVIIQPARGDQVVAMEPVPGPGACSYVTFEDLVFDARNVVGNVFKIDPKAIHDDPSLHCKFNKVVGGKIRHGKFVAGVALVGSSWQFIGVEAYENGCQTTSGDHDHAYYIQGVRNLVQGGSIHHNMHAVQVWNEHINGKGIEGHNEFRSVDIGNNGFNPWCKARRQGCGPELALYHDVGSHSTVDGCRVHDNSCGSIGLSGDWGPVPASHSRVTNNRIWGNRTDAIYRGNASDAVVEGNAFGPPDR